MEKDFPKVQADAPIPICISVCQRKTIEDFYNFLLQCILNLNPIHEEKNMPRYGIQKMVKEMLPSASQSKS
jgi:hypothetical protein